MKPSPPEPYAVVFSGGGALASWEVGAYSAILSRHGLQPPAIVTGASAGAINAAALCAGIAPGTLKQIWERLTPGDVFTWNLGLKAYGALGLSAVRRLSVVEALRRFGESRNALTDTAPLKATLTKEFRDHIQGFLQSPIACVIAATDLTRGKALSYFHQGAFAVQGRGDWQPITSLELLVQALMGTSAIPVLFPPFEHLFDGGVLQNQPIGPALQLGATRVYVLIPSPESLLPTGNLLRIADALVTNWLSANLRSHIDLVRVRNKIRSHQRKPAIGVCVVRPQLDLRAVHGTGLLAFGHNVPALVAAGEKDANDRLNRFNPADERTWY